MWLIAAKNVSFLNIFHFHLHPIQNSSALHFSTPVKNEFLFCVLFSVNYEAIKYTYAFLIIESLSEEMFQQKCEKERLRRVGEMKEMTK